MEIDQTDFKEIPGYPGYLISRGGMVLSIERRADFYYTSGHRCRRLMKQKELKTCVNKNGYRLVVLCRDGMGKSFLIHRLIAMVFIDNPESHPTINHIDGDKLNNSIENLEWCTQKHNIRHAVRTGLTVQKRGADRGSSKLNKRQVISIRKRVLSGEVGAALAREYGVSCTTIYRIVKRKLWDHV